MLHFYTHAWMFDQDGYLSEARSLLRPPPRGALCLGGLKAYYRGESIGQTWLDEQKQGKTREGRRAANSEQDRVADLEKG
jgi:hypothetical protein